LACVARRLGGTRISLLAPLWRGQFGAASSGAGVAGAAVGCRGRPARPWAGAVAWLNMAADGFPPRLPSGFPYVNNKSYLETTTTTTPPAHTYRELFPLRIDGFINEVIGRPPPFWGGGGSVDCCLLIPQRC